MQRINHYRVAFKCAQILDPKMDGYFFNGKHIECVSAYIWQNLSDWKNKNDPTAKIRLFNLLFHLKKKQSKNWDIFMKDNFKIPIHPFKKLNLLQLEEIEPCFPHVRHELSTGETIYEFYTQILS